MTAHIGNAARVLRAILTAREPEYVWTVEVLAGELSDRPQREHRAVLRPHSGCGRPIGDPDAQQQAAGRAAKRDYK
jgi:hypothetical protein